MFTLIAQRTSRGPCEDVNVREQLTFRYKTLRTELVPFVASRFRIDISGTALAIERARNNRLGRPATFFWAEQIFRSAKIRPRLAASYSNLLGHALLFPCRLLHLPYN